MEIPLYYKTPIEKQLTFEVCNYNQRICLLAAINVCNFEEAYLHLSLYAAKNDLYIAFDIKEVTFDKFYKVVSVCGSGTHYIVHQDAKLRLCYEANDENPDISNRKAAWELLKAVSILQPNTLPLVQAMHNSTFNLQLFFYFFIEVLPPLIYSSNGQLEDAVSTIEWLNERSFFSSGNTIKNIRDLNFTSSSSKFQILKEKLQETDIIYSSIQQEFVIAVFGTNELGQMVLCDIESDLRIPCQVIEKQKLNLLQFASKTVLIHKVFFIEEKYKDCDISYLLFEDQDVFALGSSFLTFPEIFVTSSCQDIKLKEQTTFFLISSSGIISCRNGATESWFKAKNTDLGTFYLCFCEKFNATVPYLQLGRSYTLYSNVLWKRFQEVEIERLDPQAKKFKLWDTDSVLVLNVNENNEYHLPCNFFKSTVVARKLSEKLSSRTPKFINTKDFGTPGENLQHEIYHTTQKLFLNNWERRVVPLGLIPGMEVQFNDVDTESGYHKTTVFTSFKLCHYEPITSYTANLNSDNPTKIYGSLINNKYFKCCIRAKVTALYCNEFKFDGNSRKISGCFVVTQSLDDYHILNCENVCIESFLNIPDDLRNAWNALMCEDLVYSGLRSLLQMSAFIMDVLCIKTESFLAIEEQEYPIWNVLHLFGTQLL